MRIDDILTESKASTALLHKIIKSTFFVLNIKPYFDSDNFDLDNIGEIPVMYHGGKLYPNEVYDIEERAKPSDSMVIVHDAVNIEAIKKGFDPIRNLIFSSRDESMAHDYGRLCLLIPLDDNYKLYFNEYIDDFYVSSEVFNRKELIQDIGLGSIMELLRSNNVSTSITHILSSHEEELCSYFHTKSISEAVDKLINYLGDNINPGSAFSHSRMFTFINRTKVASLDGLNNYIIDEHIHMGMEFIQHTLGMIFTDTSFLSTHEDSLYNLSREIIIDVVKSTKEWVLRDTKRYIDNVHSTQNLKDIGIHREIMSTPGKYATLPIRATDGLETLYVTYKNGQ